MKDSTGYEIVPGCYVRINRSRIGMTMTWGWVTGFDGEAVQVEQTRTGAGLTVRAADVTVVRASDKARNARGVTEMVMDKMTEGSRRMHRTRPMKKAKR